MLQIHMIFENKHCFLCNNLFIIIGHIGINQSILYQRIIQSSITVSLFLHFQFINDKF